MADKLEVIPGPGLVARFGNVVVWGGPQGTPALHAHLASEAQRVKDSPTGGDELATSLVAVLQRGDPEPHSPFAVLGPGANGLVLFLHGPVQAWDSGRWLAPQPVPGWMVTSIGRPWPLIVLPYGASPPPQSQPGNPMDLVAGAVPGAGFVLLRPPASPAAQAASSAGAFASSSAAPPAGGTVSQAGVAPPAVVAQQPRAVVAEQPQSGLSHQPVAGSAGAPSDLRMAGPSFAAPLPTASAVRSMATAQVIGTPCPKGHLNHPRASTCSRCAQPLSAGGPQVSGPRPPIGALLADDGSVWPLDRDCVIGTAPGSALEVQTGSAFGIPLGAGPNHSMAPVHAEVRARDWSAYLVDRAADGGVCTQAPSGGDWSPLARSEQRELSHGSHLSCGGRVLTYLSCWPA